MTATELRPLRFRHRIEFALLRSIAFIAGLLPRRAQVTLGNGIGGLAFRLIKRRRILALKNLARCLPEKPEAERRAIAKSAFKIFGRVLVDGLVQEKLMRRAESLIKYEGLEHIQAAYARGKGVFAFSAHFGNWELGALNQGRLGLPLLMVVRALDNPLLDVWLNGSRTRTGNRFAYKREAVRAMLGALREKIGVAILIDQGFTGEGSLPCEFFGQPAPTVPTLGVLAVRTGAAVIPFFSTLHPDGSYTMRYGPPLTIPDSGDRDADAAAVTRAATLEIERAIRERPDCWLWMHDRFKTG